jgi:hypothetical protein
MSTQNQSRSAVPASIGYLLSILTSSACLHAPPEAADPQAESGMSAWFGCWRLISVGEDDVSDSAEASYRVCIEPSDSPNSIEVSGIVGEKIVATETVIADRSRRSTSQSECERWQQSFLSADRRRIYRRSETVCEPAGQSRTTGASLIVSVGHWVDINVTQVGSERELVVRRYRRVNVEDPSVPTAEIHEYGALLPGEIMSMGQIARIASSTPLGEDDVIEALEILDSAVVEAMLIESNSRFLMDSDLLLRLDDAGVPDHIIDVMMALSYPNYFVIRDGSVRSRPTDNYDYNNYYYYNYGWPWYYGHGGYYYGHRGNHDHGNDRPKPPPGPKGTAIKGRGYTVVRPTNLPSGGVVIPGAGSGTGGGTGTISGVGSGPSGGSRSSTSSGGYSKGDSSSTRRAVPK